MLADIGCHAENFVMCVPCYLLNSCEIVFILMRLITRTLVHASSLSCSKLIILGKLPLSHLLFMCLCAPFSLLSSLLDLNLILAFSFLSFLLFLLALLKLLLFPFFAFGRHLGLFLLLLRLLLLFPLLPLSNDLFLLFPRGFLSSSTSIPLLLLLLFPLPFFLFTLGCDSLLRLAPFNILLAVARLGSLTRFNFGFQSHPFLVSFLSSPQ